MPEVLSESQELLDRAPSPAPVGSPRATPEPDFGAPRATPEPGFGSLLPNPSVPPKSRAGTPLPPKSRAGTPLPPQSRGGTPLPLEPRVRSTVVRLVFGDSGNPSGDNVNPSGDDAPREDDEQYHEQVYGPDPIFDGEGHLPEVQERGLGYVKWGLLGLLACVFVFAVRSYGASPKMDADPTTDLKADVVPDGWSVNPDWKEDTDVMFVPLSGGAYVKFHRELKGSVFNMTLIFIQPLNNQTLKNSSVLRALIPGNVSNGTHNITSGNMTVEGGWFYYTIVTSTYDNVVVTVYNWQWTGFVSLATATATGLLQFLYRTYQVQQAVAAPIVQVPLL
eukprot:762559-Hanusia_phi.AAC.5